MDFCMNTGAVWLFLLIIRRSKACCLCAKEPIVAHKKLLRKQMAMFGSYKKIQFQNNTRQFPKDDKI